jgi:hypothetical protein
MKKNLTAGQTSSDKKPEYGETQPKRGDIKEQADHSPARCAGRSLPG